MLVMASGGIGRIEPVMWFRTKKDKIEWGDYTNLSTSYYDALKFQAKRDVLFCGVGMIKEYEDKPFTLEMKYRVVAEGEDGDVEATIIEVDSETSPVNEEKMHWFDIQHYGQNAVFCPEGSFIEIGLKSKEGGTRFHYIYSGYDYNYSDVPGQEYDFRTVYSNWN